MCMDCGKIDEFSGRKFWRNGGEEREGKWDEKNDEMGNVSGCSGDCVHSHSIELHHNSFLPQFHSLF